MKNNIKIVYLIGFLFSLPIALISYINSSFLENQVGKDYIGFIYAISSILTIIALFSMPKILSAIGNRLTIILSSFFIFSSFILMALNNDKITTVLSFIIYFISVNFVISSLDIFIEDFSKKYPVGKLRGLYLTITNMAWVVAQIISGLTISKASYSGTYFLSSIIIIFVIITIILFIKDFKDPKYKKISISNTIKTFTKNKNLSKIYISHLVLQFFFAWMVIYTPIYLYENIGFSWDKIGIIFGIMLLPFVMLDFPLGKLSDKIGEKKMLLMGFLIMSSSVFVLPFLKEPNLWLFALILFITRIGAATIETMNESYFFKIVNEDDADEISFFRNAPSVAYIIAPLLATSIFLFIPSFKYIFFILSAIILVGFFTSLKIKDIK